MGALLLESPAMQVVDGERMRTRREELGISQTVAAKRAGMTAPRWSDIESGGRTNVKLETLSRIADALDMDARDLLTPREKRRKK